MVSAFFTAGAGVGVPGLGVLAGGFTVGVPVAGVRGGVVTAGVPGVGAGVTGPAGPVGPVAGAGVSAGFATLISGKLCSTSGEIVLRRVVAAFLCCLNEVVSSPRASAFLIEASRSLSLVLSFKYS